MIFSEGIVEERKKDSAKWGLVKRCEGGKWEEVRK
jgi:hypothetical protein